MPTSADLADTEGPNASLQQGEATQMHQLQREAGLLTTGPGTPKGSNPPPQGPAGGPAPSPGPPAAPPTQPSPAQPKEPFNARNAFSRPVAGKGPISQGWRHEIELMAQHPAAGPALRALDRITKSAQ